MELRRRRGAFTLVELLVVIAIMSILAAIFYPVLTAAKESSNTAKCQAHQKELLQALIMYTDAWHGKLPWIQFLTYHDFEGGLGRYPQIHLVRLYEPYVRNFDILICPTKRQAYAYNEILCGPLALRKASIPMAPNRCECYDISVRAGRPYSSIRRPSRTPAFLCAKRFHPAPGDLGPNGWGFAPEDASNSDRILNLHNDGINYGFLDGHSKWRQPCGARILIATDGLDWDGNGTVGDNSVMR